MKLSQLSERETGIITKVSGRGAFRKRILEMGFVKGEKVTVVKNAPLKDPIEYTVMGYEVSLRRSEASLIEVVTEKDEEVEKQRGFNGVTIEHILDTEARKKEKTINVALVGNPNSGKTTIFNYASGSRERVGNYGGVTIDSKTAVITLNDYTFNITDLPGTYSLSAYSPEELYVRDHIIHNTPDVVVNIIDASNLERNLYLTTQLIDMDIKVVIALNMFDEMQKRKDTFKMDELGKMIGIPFVPTVGSKGKGVLSLFEKVIDVYNDIDSTIRHIHVNYGSEIEKSIQKIQEKIKIQENYSYTDKVSSRYTAIRLIEKDRYILERLKDTTNFNDIKAVADIEIKKLENEFVEDTETIIIDAKYGFISGALKETFDEGKTDRYKITKSIDNVLTNKLFGFPVFIFFMWLMFFCTFKLGDFPMRWIENLILLLGDTLSKTMTDGSFKDLLIDGVIGGVGGVIVFLPNILILFFFISIMEDTGYMARAAFIMDKIMHKMGLHGKSFIPLIMGFGCNVPAIMATRVIENRKNRILTMLINPLMSCSARLPVYVLIIGAIFPAYRGSILFSLYLIGILIAILVSLLFKKLFFKTEEAPFVMELPPYRMPHMKSLFKHMWYKSSQYLRKMGGVILIASIIIWALGYFPRDIPEMETYQQRLDLLDEQYQNNRANSREFHKYAEEYALQIDEIQKEMSMARQENSYIGRIGKAIEPAIAPLGFDWRMGVGLVTGVAAKEIVVSTLGVLYHADDMISKNTESLPDKLRKAEYSYGKRKGTKVFTPLASISFLLFILIYFPCIAVIAAIKKESGTWKWALFTIIYTTGLAWLVSLIVYQTGSLMGY